MRPIKFRAWDKDRKEMLEVTHLYWYDFGNGKFKCVRQNGGSTVAEEHLEIMQFSGLIDKNGTEIWEDDIVRNSADPKYPARARFDHGFFQVDNWPLGSFNAADLEVIGNIYENLELMDARPLRED